MPHPDLQPATAALSELAAQLRRGLRGESAKLENAGMADIAAEGQLLRPLVAVAGLGSNDTEPVGFWSAVLAVQLAHEASLVHDDVIDEASHRRGRSTLVAQSGVAAAVLRGDHLLTTAYRAACDTGNVQFMQLFARAVERTVAGEKQQAKLTAHASVDMARYSDVARGKSGELLGCALATAATLRSRGAADALFELGRELGMSYQMLDDLLDYCRHARTGKSPFADYSQGRRTFVNVVAPELSFGLSTRDVEGALYSGGADGVMARTLAAFLAHSAALRAAVVRQLPADAILTGLIDSWTTVAREAVLRETAIASLAHRGANTSAAAYLAEHSRSFDAATRFFAGNDRARVARVYAFCRATDDLVDLPRNRIDPALLDAWHGLARDAYELRETGVDLLDGTMRDMAAAGVPFEYVTQLVEGMRMDLAATRFETMADLRLYTYRVASVVGLWLTRLHGVHEPHLLDRAERLGHAMQLTNIARDVGEDWRRGRIYIPSQMRDSHGITDDALAAMCAGAPMTAGYCAMMEELLVSAEAEYRMAIEVIPMLPATFARPVMVAAHLYRGIHEEIRERGYNNLTHRAYTSPFAKSKLTAAALWELYAPPRLTGRRRPMRTGRLIGQQNGREA